MEIWDWTNILKPVCDSMLSKGDAIMGKSIFVFDFNCLAKVPAIDAILAEDLDISEELSRLNVLALEGHLTPTEFLKMRLAMLRSLPLNYIKALFAKLPLEPSIFAFIRKRSDDCLILSLYPGPWIESLGSFLGCRIRGSALKHQAGQYILSDILDRAAAVRELGTSGRRLVAVGSSESDLPMFEEADVGVAVGLLNEPAPTLIQIADYVVYTGETLCRLLNTL